METIFISLQKKMELELKLRNGDLEAIKIVFNEFGRLESVIRDYELGMRLINDKMESKNFKTPAI